MEIKVLLSFRFLVTFILLCSSFPHSRSLSNLAHSTPNRSRRILGATPPAIVRQFLTPHNRVRAKLGLQPLKWSEKLAKFANSWANQRKGDCELIHSNTNYGENIFWGSGKDWKPANAVHSWATEKKFYSYRKNACLHNQACGHYTQMVWRDSLRLGCAKVVCNGGDTFITCNYDPHGNVVGQKPY